MISIGPYNIYSIVLDLFKLDGGAMFGSVPKSLWEREISPDSSNRVPLCSRSLVIEGLGRKIIVDLGCGKIWSEKEREIFQVVNQYNALLEDVVPGVTDVVLTHLHFDHAGGLGRLDGEKIVPNFPGAKYWLGRENFERASSPGVREKVSYRKVELEVLKQVNLDLVEDGSEILPGISMHFVYGHTRGLSYVRISDEGRSELFFVSDLCPTSKHLKIPYVMGYDLLAEVSMEEKQKVLGEIYEKSSLVVFQHDIDVSACYLGKDERGNFICRDILVLDKNL